ncbi:MAG: hypothetical protein ACI4MY_05390 [Christensenellales bacterium]
MKKLITILLTIIIGACTLVGCANVQVPGNQNSGEQSGTPIVQTMSKGDLITISAVSVGNLMAGIDAPAIGVTAFALAEQEEPIDQTQLVDKINYYMTVVQNVIGSGAESVFEESDIAEYAIKNVITTTSFGESKQYVLYYNETLLVEEEDEEDATAVNQTVTEDEEDGEEDGERVDATPTDENETIATDEEEQEFRMVGIMIIGDQTYEFEGKREVEEGEFEFEFVAKIDADNYVRFAQEIEEDEQEFDYTIVENGQVIKSFSLEVESEEGETEVSLKEKSVDSSMTIKYEVQVDEDGNEYIEIKVNDNGEVIKCEARVEIDPVTGEKTYRYDFGDGNKYDKHPYSEDKEKVDTTLYTI